MAMTTPPGEPIVLVMDPKLGRGLRPWLQRNCWARLPRPRSLAVWNAGTPGCCAVWSYRTPWGAVAGAFGLHERKAGRYTIDRVALLWSSMVLTLFMAGVLLWVLVMWHGPGRWVASIGFAAMVWSFVLQWAATGRRAR
jgi:hypothetical protein